MSPHLLSSLSFFSLLSYSPRGTNEISKRSCELVSLVKYYDKNFSERFILRLQEQFNSNIILNKLLSADNLVLVPVPRNYKTPTSPKNEALWPSMLFCNAIKQAGIKCTIDPMLIRKHKVPKSSMASKGDRPSPEVHFQSFELNSNIPSGNNIVLVDDFLTRGSTFIGAASKILSVFPNINVQAFSVVRTISDGNIDEILDPCSGVISYLGENRVVREP